MSALPVTVPARVDLAWLLEGFAPAPPAPGVALAGLASDSRAVGPGYGFVALAGRTSHGLEHLPEALARGAVAVLFDPRERAAPALPAGVAAVPVADLAVRLGAIADRFHDEPSAQLRVAGITGTNGKTTCAWLLAQATGARGAYLGTLGAGRPPQVAAGTHTTPDCLTVHRLLRALRDAGADHVACEVSSHALDQGRVDGVRMPVVGFTNLSRDHLDYHGTMQAYGAAKERLFDCRGVEHAVINVDDEFGRAVAARLRAGVALTAVSAAGARVAVPRFVVAESVRASGGGLELEGTTHVGPFRLRSPLVGRFNAENLLVVLGMLLADGRPLGPALESLAAAAAPPGRMEAFGAPGRPLAVVDYAHTPDALAKVLAALREHCRGRLWCVFGCGGERDAGKRPQMAAAAEAADEIVVTDDNPRGEDGERIVADVRAGFSGRVPVRVERDRARAIELALVSAAPVDVVLVAGKGHEDRQIVGTERRPHSDRAIVRRLQEERT